MLIAGIFTDSIKNMFEYGIFSLLLYIDSVVYKIVSMLFSVFYSIAELQILNNDVYEAIADRVYLLVGVIALFAITVSLMKALVNPDNFAKGTITSFKNLVISILLVILMPTIFKYAFSLQAAIISDGVIANVFNFSISGNETQMVNICNNPQKVTVGNAASTLNSDDETVEYTVNDCQANFITMQVLKAFFQPYDSSISNNYKTNWEDAEKYMIYTGNFDYILTFVEQVTNGTDTNYITYYALLSTAAGIFLGYIVLSFCIDLGVRAFKLAFYQLIAPIPILMKIIPGKEGQFDKWSKQTISTFLEVFVRLIIVSFVVFMCGNLFDLLESFELGNVKFLAKAILALGLFTFAKQAPKLLKDALGLDGTGVKFGIKGKLTDVPVAGKAFAAGYGVANKFQGAATGALGAGYSSLINGGKFKDGARFGAASGWKNGGKQFGSMHQETYRQMGYKGKAGWFGGQSWMDKRIDDNRDKFSDNFKDNVLRKWVQDFENDPNGIWQKSYRQKSDEMNNYYKNLLTKSKNDYSNLVSNRDSEIRKINDKFASDFMEFQKANPNVDQSVLNAKVKEIEAKEQASIKAINEKYANQINTLQKNIHDSESLLSGGSATRINSKGFQETFSIDSDSKKYAIGIARDAEPTYDNRKTIDEKRLNEKAVKEYTNSLEGQQAIAVQQQAMKNLQKDGPTPAKPDSGGNKK